jgi:hypothetical protein
VGRSQPDYQREVLYEEERSFMADIQLTDDLGKSAPDVKIDLSRPLLC